MEYTNGKLEAIYNAEGRNYNTNITSGSSTLAMRYEYNITDHLGNVRLSYTDKDNDGVIEQSTNAALNEVLQETHYYPFGMNLDGPWITGGDNQYLYNGKEWEDDHDLGLIDYGARWYDPSIARWNAVDPLATNYFTMTPYAYCGNNPIRFIDPDGRFFTERSQKFLDDLDDEMTSTINRMNKKIARAKRKGKSDKIGKLQKRKAAFESEFATVRSEINDLRESNQEYDIYVDRINNSSEPYSDAIGGARFNFDNGKFEIRIPGASRTSLLAHELKHAHQFEIGEFSSGFTIRGDEASNGFYDKQDEVEAYKRGDFFGGNDNVQNSSDLDEIYNFLPEGPWNSSNHPYLNNEKVPAELQQRANVLGQAFRVNGVTYYKKK